jgi:hypothetical protein
MARTRKREGLELIKVRPNETSCNPSFSRTSRWSGERSDRPECDSIRWFPLCPIVPWGGELDLVRMGGGQLLYHAGRWIASAVG